MARDHKELRRRLRQAALELYRDQGFEGTTAAQIAARVGVTGRTFFRHFPDKQEVLFEEDALRTVLLAGVTEAPAGAGPADALHHAFQAAEPLLEENRPSADLRREVIAATPALQERALAKTARLTNELAAALRQRGVQSRLADLAAQVGMAACTQAMLAWADQPSGTFRAHLDQAFADLRSLTVPGRS